MAENQVNVNNDQENVDIQNPQPEQAKVTEEISAKEAFGGMGRWIKKTAKKGWQKAKKPLAIAGGCLAVAGATMVGLEMSQQRKDAELPPGEYPQIPEQEPVMDAEYQVTDTSDVQTEETTE